MISSPIDVSIISGDLTPSVLVAKVCSSISSFDISSFHDIPLLFQKINGKFGTEDIKLITSEFIPAIKKAYASLGMKSSQSYESLLADIADILPKDLCDDFLYDLIPSLVENSDCRLRILCANLFKKITNVEPLKSELDVLLNDRVQSVRLSAIASVPFLKLDEKKVTEIVQNGVNDTSTQVKNEIVKVIPLYPTKFISLYNQMLQSPRTAQTAIREAPKMVQANGLSVHIEAIKAASKMFPENVALILVDLAENATDTDKEHILCLAELFSNDIGFLQNLYKFSQFFNDKMQLIKFLDPKGEPKWRQRMVKLGQCILFSNDVGEEMIDFVPKFAFDQVAIVREQSIRLVLNILNHSQNFHSCFVKIVECLLCDRWQQRYLLTKIIKQIGFENTEVLDVVEKLANDTVANVRYGMALSLMDSVYFEKYFENSKDPDISFFNPLV